MTFAGFYQYFGLNILLIPYLVMTSGFIVAAFVDFEHRIIPDEVSLGGIAAGLILSLLIPQMHDFSRAPWAWKHLHSLWLSLLGVLIGGGSIYAMGVAGDFIFKKESMGGGDVKFLAMIGAFLGWEGALLTFFIAPFFGAVFGIIHKIRKNESAIPYGPFLALGALIALFWGQRLIALLLGRYGNFM